MDVLEINGKEYPFGLTARGRLNLESSKVDLNKVAVNEQEALRFAFEACKGACKGSETEFKFDFNAFVDKVEATVFIKARSLAKLLQKPEVFGTVQAKAQDQAKAETKKK